MSAPADLPRPPAPASLVANSAWLFLVNAVGIAVTAGVSILAVRSFTVAGWGHFSTAMALVAMLVVFAEMGIATWTLRGMSRPGADHGRILGQAMAAVTCTALAFAALVIPIGLLIGYGDQVLLLLAIAAPALLLQPLFGLQRSAFNSFRVMRLVALATLAQQAVYTVLAIVLIITGAGPKGLVIAFVAGLLTAAVVAGRLSRRHLGLRAELRGALHSVPGVVRMSAPIAVVGGLGIVYQQLDLVLLSKLGTAAEVAFYSVAYTMMRMTTVVPSVIGSAFFPVFLRQQESDPELARGSFLLIARIFVVLGMPLALVLSIGAHDIVTFLYGDRYGEAADALQVVAWSGVLVFQNYVIWYGLLAAGAERTVIPIQIAGLVLNIALNVVLIPEYGPVGAAIALVASDLVVVSTQYVILNRRMFPIPVFELLLRPAVGTALAVAAGLLVAQASGFAGALVAAAIFVGWSHASGYVSPAEWEPLTGPLRRALRR